MLKDLFLLSRYPHTAGVIAAIWLSSAALIAVDDRLPVAKMVIINIVASSFIALIGFRGSTK